MSEPRTLGIDYGEKRVGAAISDALGITAQPLELIKNAGRDAVIARINEIVDEYGVTAVVVGMPLNMDGTMGPKAREALEFRNVLAAALDDVPVLTYDERLTTVEAARRLSETGQSRKKRGEKVDVVAAQILRQSYLESRKNRNSEDI